MFGSIQSLLFVLILRVSFCITWTKINNTETNKHFKTYFNAKVAVSLEGHSGRIHCACHTFATAIKTECKNIRLNRVFQPNKKLPITRKLKYIPIITSSICSTQLNMRWQIKLSRLQLFLINLFSSEVEQKYQYCQFYVVRKNSNLKFILELKSARLCFGGLKRF